jgi:hypothetical protein
MADIWSALPNGLLTAKACRRASKNITASLGGGYSPKIIITGIEVALSAGAYNGTLWIGAEGHSAHQSACPARRSTKRTGSPPAIWISLENVLVIHLLASILETNAFGRLSHGRDKLLAAMALPGIEIVGARATAQHHKCSYSNNIF